MSQMFGFCMMIWLYFVENKTQCRLMCIDTRRFADGNNFKSCVTLTFCFCHFLGKFNPWLILFGFFHTFCQFDFVLVVVIQIGNIFFSIDKLYHNSYLHCISTNWTFSSRNAFTVLLKIKKKRIIYWETRSCRCCCAIVIQRWNGIIVNASLAEQKSFKSK